jgi:Ca2+-transporting ATPase
VTLAAFLWSLKLPGTDMEHSVTAAFMTLALAQTFHLGNARDAEPVLAWRKAIANRWALAAVGVTVSLQFLAVYFPPLAAVLGVRPLAVRDWLVIVPLAALPALVGQAVAWVRLRRRPVGA